MLTNSGAHTKPPVFGTGTGPCVSAIRQPCPTGLESPGGKRLEVKKLGCWKQLWKSNSQEKKLASPFPDAAEFAEHHTDPPLTADVPHLSLCWTLNLLLSS